MLWENEDDITLVESVLKILPDTSPCDLAIICRKQCSEGRLMIYIVSRRVDFCFNRFMPFAVPRFEMKRSL